MTSSTPVPRVFLSYAWETPAHRKWVSRLATRLRGDGIAASLDSWEVAPGEELTRFMETAIRENDFVLVICTPRYKEKSDARLGGVGYEGTIMTGEVLNHLNKRKFIPLLRKGEWFEAGPSWLLSSFYIDLRKPRLAGGQYQVLLDHLHGRRETAPPIGPPPPKVPRTPFWLKQAEKAARFVKQNHFEVHRGAFLWCPSVTAVFGNEGYDPGEGEPLNERHKLTRQIVKQFQERLRAEGITELAFGKSPDGYTWALLVDDPDAERLNECLWDSYPPFIAGNHVQRHTNDHKLGQFRKQPFKDRCDD